MMTSCRYTVLPSYIEEMKAVKNDVEINGLRLAYLRDGAAHVRWLAWIEQKIQQGDDITEYEAAQRLTEYRRKNKYYMDLAYENISATGPNAGGYLSHCSCRTKTDDELRAQHCPITCRTRRPQR